jgi:hypothetical protein
VQTKTFAQPKERLTLEGFLVQLMRGTKPRAAGENLAAGGAMATTSTAECALRGRTRLGALSSAEFEEVKLEGEDVA